MTPITFGEAMQEILHRRRLSATAAAEILGFKSKTAFFRILKDECRPSSLRKCYEAVAASEAIAADEKELSRLKNAISVNEIGKKAYAMNRVLENMLHPQEEDDVLPDIRIEGLDTIKTAAEAIRLLPQDKTVQVVLLGRCPRALLRRIHRLTQEANVTQILHFFAIDEDDSRDIEVMNDISSILFSGVYTARYLNETGANTKNWGVRSGILTVFVRGNNGVETIYMFFPMGPDCYFVQKDANGDTLKFWEMMLEKAWTAAEPMKVEHVVDSNISLIDRYTSFTQNLLDIERHRAVYMIKPDFPINCVPKDILRGVVVDGLAAMDDQEIDEGKFEELAAIHEARVHEMYHGRKDKVIVLNVDAMMRFAKTGMRSDHIFMCRPYSVRERMAILTLLRDHARSNPHFILRFAKGENLVSDKEVDVYDNYGVSLIKADTSWRLEGDHSETMLESPSIAECFKQYILQEILPGETMTLEETVALLDEMIAVAKQAS